MLYCFEELDLIDISKRVSILDKIGKFDMDYSQDSELKRTDYAKLMNYSNIKNKLNCIFSD